MENILSPIRIDSSLALTLKYAIVRLIGVKKWQFLFRTNLVDGHYHTWRHFNSCGILQQMYSANV